MPRYTYTYTDRWKLSLRTSSTLTVPSPQSHAVWDPTVAVASKSSTAFKLRQRNALVVIHQLFSHVQDIIIFQAVPSPRECIIHCFHFNIKLKYWWNSAFLVILSVFQRRKRKHVSPDVSQNACSYKRTAMLTKELWCKQGKKSLPNLLLFQYKIALFQFSAHVWTAKWNFSLW